MNENIINANGKFVRHNGKTFRVLSCRLGSKVLADAENVQSGERINLMKSRSADCLAVRHAIDQGLLS